ncbi:MAG TPA: YraN family protein [Candidatus Wunengus sp. YC64]
MFKRKIKEPSYKRDVGTRGEQLAVKFLKKSGYKILQRNYRCKLGEIDIVCYDHGAIAFVEVKTRYSDTYGPPELSVTEAKKRQILKVALHYVAEKKIEGIDSRFDVVSIFHTPMKKQPEITLFKNAFTKNDSHSSRI